MLIQLLYLDYGPTTDSATTEPSDVTATTELLTTVAGVSVSKNR